jgi:hypothetical protein
MAYMNQERKAIIAAELKKVMPKDWKYSLAVRHHSTIVLTISEAPVDLASMLQGRAINQYWLQNQFSGELLETFTRIKDALNTGNHDRSDSQSDYFDVGWYVTIRVGAYKRPFRFVPKASDPQPGSAAYEALRRKVEALEAKAALKEYWDGSASQSVMNDYASGNVVRIEAK